VAEAQEGEALYPEALNDGIEITLDGVERVCEYRAVG
jgi:hypothetical protein